MRNKMLLWGSWFIEKAGWIFTPFSWVWAATVFCKNRLYDCGFFRIEKVSCTVISVGNISAGGTGKTPFVYLLAKTFAHHNIAILSRGYGAMPDEALMLKKKIPSVKVYIGKKREALAYKAAAEGAALILMDDGLQYRKLHRDIEIVLLREGKMHQHYLPRGFLRDSPQRIEQADAVFYRERDFSLSAVGILDAEGKTVSIGKNEKVGMFCGIANPSSFKKTIASLGVQCVAEWVLADHETASRHQLEKFVEKCCLAHARAILTTEKDFIKLLESKNFSLPIYWVAVELQWMQGAQKWENLVEKIERKIDTYTKIQEKGSHI